MRHDEYFSSTCDCKTCRQDPDPAPAGATVTDFTDIWSLPLDMDEAADRREDIEVTRQHVTTHTVMYRPPAARRVVGGLVWDEPVDPVEVTVYRAVIR